MFKIVTNSIEGGSVSSLVPANPAVVGTNNDGPEEMPLDHLLWLGGKFGDGWVLCHPADPKNQEMFIPVHVSSDLPMMEQVRVVIDKSVKLHEICLDNHEELDKVLNLRKRVIFDSESSARHYRQECENFVKAEERMAKRVKENA